MTTLDPDPDPERPDPEVPDMPPGEDPGVTPPEPGTLPEEPDIDLPEHEPERI
ncbi:MAG TPA: hypothetical protein VFN93_11020 [Gaiellaceae bacterium]|nr:hypothetical protein [Gaiellaceae bacterium]